MAPLQLQITQFIRSFQRTYFKMLKSCLKLRSLTQRMKCFPNWLDSFPIPTGERTYGKCLESGRPFQKTCMVIGRTYFLSHSKRTNLTFFLPVKPSSSSSGLPISATGNVRCASLPHGELQCATAFNKSSPKAGQDESKNMFFTSKSL